MEKAGDWYFPLVVPRVSLGRHFQLFANKTTMRSFTYLFAALLALVVNAE